MKHRFSERAARSAVFAVLAVSALTASGWAGVSPASDELRAPPGGQWSIDEIRRQLLDPRLTELRGGEAVRPAWGALGELDIDDQIDVLRDVVEHGPAATAPFAVIELIRHRRVEESIDVIVRRLPDWPHGVDSALLSAIDVIYSDQAKDMVILPRRILRRHVEGRTPYEERWKHGMLGAVDLAAVLLRESSDPEDRELLRRAALVFPRSPQVWLALAGMDAVRAPQRELGLSMYRDPELSHVLRTAIAVALAPSTPEAAQIAREHIETVIDEIGAIDLVRMVGRMLHDEADEHDLRLYMRYKAEVMIAPMFGSLQTEDAQGLAAQALEARNLNVRLVGALVAAERWPLWFMDLQDHALTVGERSAVLAYLAHTHPDLADAARESAPDTRTFDTQRSLIESGGVSRTMDFVDDGDGGGVWLYQKWR